MSFKGPPDDLKRVVNPHVEIDDNGDTVAVGPYRLGKEIGTGTFARVHECVDVENGEAQMAIKIYLVTDLVRKKSFLNSSPPSDGDGGPRLRAVTALDKLYDVLRILQSIGHANCVPLHNVLHTEGRYGAFYLVTEYLEYGSAMVAVDDGVVVGGRPRHAAAYTVDFPRRTITVEAFGVEMVRWRAFSHSPSAAEAESAGLEYASGMDHEGDSSSAEGLLVYSEDVAKSLIKDLAQALAYLHSDQVNVAHRDIKPDNVLIGKDGVAKLGDFGVACKMEPDHRVRRTEGTYYFLAPECCCTDGNLPYEGHDGRAADVWALGVTLWTFLAGTLPFEGRGLSELFESISRGEWQLPADVSSVISEDCLAVLRATMARDPSARATASDLLDMKWFASANRSSVVKHVSKVLEARSAC